MDSAPRQQQSFALSQYSEHAFLEALHWRTIGIVNLIPITTVQQGKSHTSETLGTGVATVWGKSRLIITAKHNLVGAGRSDIEFFPRPSTRLSFAESFEEVTAGANRRDVLEGRTVLPIAAIHRADTEDLAAIELTASSELQKNIHFHALPDTSSITPSNGTTLTCLGHPSSTAVVTGVQRVPGNDTFSLAVILTLISGTLSSHPPDGAELPDYTPTDHRLMTFAAAERGLHPGGFSGAGVWYPEQHQNAEEGRVWIPRPGLAGICVSYYPRKRILRLIRIERVIEFLRGLPIA
jgi:hypothetical protein